MSRYDKRISYQPKVFTFSIQDPMIENSPIKIIKSYLKEKKKEDIKQQKILKKVSNRERLNFVRLISDTKATSCYNLKLVNSSSDTILHSRDFKEPIKMMKKKLDLSSSRISLMNKLKSITSKSLTHLSPFKTTNNSNPDKKPRNFSHITIPRISLSNYLKTTSTKKPNRKVHLLKRPGNHLKNEKSWKSLN
jgi:hypothetical protein